MRNCPVDDFTLRPVTYEDVTIDTCPHCSGVWLDAGELESIQSAQTSDFRDVPSGGAMDSVSAAEDMAKARSESPRGCVVCNAGLEKKEYAFTSQVMIDQCPNGHGMWLDKDELARLEMFYEDQEDLDKILASMEEEDKAAGGLFAKLSAFLRAT